MITFVIVHYNTPILTTCLCSSIAKFHKDYKIVLFDNSDKFPFENRELFNVTYIDNTKNQLIDFDEELSEVPNLLKETSIINSNHGSFKHTRSIQWVFDNMKLENFILLDSDILLKENCEDIIDENVCASGKLGIDRLEPFLLYINLKKCKKESVNFFDVKRMIYVSSLEPKTDTGGVFLENIKTKNLPFNIIDTNKKMIHLASASWNKVNYKKWLFDNQNLWK